MSRRFELSEKAKLAFRFSHPEALVALLEARGIPARYISWGGRSLIQIRVKEGTGPLDEDRWIGLDPNQTPEVGEEHLRVLEEAAAVLEAFADRLEEGFRKTPQLLRLQQMGALR